MNSFERKKYETLTEFIRRQKNHLNSNQDIQMEKLDFFFFLFRLVVVSALNG